MPDNRHPTMDGFNKMQPLTEGYLRKGGINATSQITKRPPAPAPMRIGGGSTSAASSTAANPKPPTRQP